MFSGLSNIMPYLALILIVHTVMAALAIINVVQRRKVAGGRKWLWMVVIVIMVILGPVIYFFAGRIVEDSHDAES